MLLQWHDWSFTEARRFIWSPDLDLDYGHPLESGKEVSEGVFQRKWSKRTVTLNCSDFVEYGAIRGIEPLLARASYDEYICLSISSLIGIFLLKA